jgi:predicted nucleic acid-binding protein
MVGMSLRFPSGYVLPGDALNGASTALGQFGISSANAKHSSGRGHDPQGAQDLGLAGRALSKEHGRICRKACDYRQMTQIPQDNSNAAVRAIAIIDTNAVLDAWWFEDPQVAHLALAVTTGQLSWAATATMRVELMDVLARQPFSDQPDRCERTLAAFDQWASILDAPSQPSPLSCADPDDQCFIDLALACSAGWLFTRDRALLDLAPRAARHGCRIVPPSAWPRDPPAATSAVDRVP